MRRTLVPALLCALLFTACDEHVKPAAPKAKADPVAAMQGGDPIPEGAMKVVFPWMGKQSIMCVGDAVERQVAFVDFSTDDAPDMLGVLEIAADGAAKGSFTVRATDLRSGHSDRDEKLLSGGWLDAESNPTLGFAVKSAKRVKPTVWRLEGTWTMRGVSKPVSFLANVRHIPEMQYLGKNIARVKGSFEIDLIDHGMDNGTVGSPACARKWTVELVVLGLITKG